MMRSCIVLLIVVISILSRVRGTNSLEAANKRQTYGPKAVKDIHECPGQSLKFPLDATSLIQHANVHSHIERHVRVSNSSSKEATLEHQKPAATMNFEMKIDVARDLVNKILSGVAKEKVETVAIMISSVGVLIAVVLAFVLGIFCCALCLYVRRRRGQGSDSRLGTGGVMGPWASVRIEHEPRKMWDTEAERMQETCSESLPWASQSKLMLRGDEADSVGTAVSLAAPTLAGVQTFLSGRAGKTPQTSSREDANQSRFSAHGLGHRSTQLPEERILPPPLCRSFVLPVCEARYGIPMQITPSLRHAISNPDATGELDILGLSKNIVLRAVVRRLGDRRTLELGIPEANSAPRATIGPAENGSKSLEIRGLRGGLYGMLELTSSNECCVVKDGRKVLVVAGNAADLQLAVRSLGGVELAAVSPSIELFDGVEHLQVRVEPGVDTVLVLSCVLAMLLLSS